MNANSQLDRLRELLRQKEEEQAPSVSLETPPTLSVVVEKVEEQEETPDTERLDEVDPRPKSLEGLRLMDLRQLFTDGGLDKDARDWIERRCLPDENGNRSITSLLGAVMARARRRG